MTAPAKGQLIPITSLEQAQEMFFANIMAKDGQNGGAENEGVFVNRWNHLPLEDGQEMFRKLKRFYDPKNEGGVDFVTEYYAGKEWIVGLKGDKLQGAYSLEPGYFPEFAAGIFEKPEEVRPKLELYLSAVRTVAKDMGFENYFGGVREGYAEFLPEHSPRYRAFMWESFAGKFEPNYSYIAQAIRLVHYGTMGFQPTVDPCKDRFNVVKSVALIGDPILALQFNSNGKRLARIRRYANIFPNQFKPLKEAWLSPTARHTTDLVIQRLWNTEVGFRVPDPNNLQRYDVLGLDQHGRPPTVASLVEAGRGKGPGVEFMHQDICTTMGVDFQAGGASRKFMYPTVEWRMPDSSGNVDDMVAMVNFAMRTSYDENVNDRFLRSASEILDQDGIGRFYDAACNPDKSVGLRTIVGDHGVTAGEIAEYGFREADFKNLLARRIYTFGPSGPALNGGSHTTPLANDDGPPQTPVAQTMARAGGEVAGGSRGLATASALTIDVAFEAPTTMRFFAPEGLAR